MAPLSFQLDENDGVDILPNNQDGIKSRVPLGFTSDLLHNIRASKVKMNAWVEREKEKANLAAESYRLRLEEEQESIDRKAAELQTIQRERGLASRQDNSNDIVEGEDNLAARKQALEEQTAHMKMEILKLENQRNNRKERVQVIDLEETKQRLRAEDARKLKVRAEEAKKTTVDDLTKGIVNYKKVGLDFEKTNVENELRFSFSQIDESDPERKFSFILIVDENEKYAISDCQPMLDPSTLSTILETLNQTEDMGFLVRKMRHSFKQLIAA